MALDPALRRFVDEEPEMAVSVVVALERPVIAPGPRTREEFIDERRAAFAHASANVRELVKRHGGAVTDEAWLSSSLRVTLPARALLDVEAAAGVRAVGVPPPLEREAAVRSDPDEGITRS